MFSHVFKSSDFRGRNGVQPDGSIDPEADAAAKRYWAKRKKTALPDAYPNYSTKIAPIGPKGTLEREGEVLTPLPMTEPIPQERKTPKNPLKAQVFAQPATAVAPVVPAAGSSSAGSTSSGQ